MWEDEYSLNIIKYINVKLCNCIKKLLKSNIDAIYMIYHVAFTFLLAVSVVPNQQCQHHLKTG